MSVIIQMSGHGRQMNDTRLYQYTLQEGFHFFKLENELRRISEAWYNSNIEFE